MSSSSEATRSSATPYEGVDADEWQQMLARGSAAGTLHAEEIAHVLRRVELTGDVLAEVQQHLSAKGITIELSNVGGEYQNTQFAKDTKWDEALTSMGKYWFWPWPI